MSRAHRDQKTELGPRAFRLFLQGEARMRRLVDKIQKSRDVINSLKENNNAYS